MRWSSVSNEDDGNNKGEKSHKSSIKSPPGGGGLFQTHLSGGGAYLI